MITGCAAKELPIPGCASPGGKTAASIGKSAFFLTFVTSEAAEHRWKVECQTIIGKSFFE